MKKICILLALITISSEINLDFLDQDEFKYKSYGSEFGYGYRPYHHGQKSSSLSSVPHSATEAPGFIDFNENGFKELNFLNPHTKLQHEQVKAVDNSKQAEKRYNSYAMEHRYNYRPYY